MEEEKRRYISLIEWTKHDVVVYYKKAKNKAEEVGILAQLTDSDEETIIAILEEAGVWEGAYKICSMCGKDFPFNYKRGKHILCPQCKEKETKIQQLEMKITRNMIHIEHLARENAKMRQTINELKEVKQNHENY